MSKMHSLAKVLIAIIDIYWVIKAFGWLFHSFIYIFNNTSNGGRNFENLLIIFASLAFQIGIMIFLIAVLWKRNKIAEKIVGKTEMLSAPQSQLDWIPFAFRLASVIAGLYCFSTAIFYIGRLAGSYRLITYKPFYASSILEQSLSLFITLAAGVYLFCGAPHFVRWQTKKTLEICTTGAENRKEQ